MGKKKLPANVIPITRKRSNRNNPKQGNDQPKLGIFERLLPDLSIWTKKNKD